MLARFFQTFRHLFTPHHTNNHRPKLLYPSSLSVLAGIVLLTSSAIHAFAGVSGGVLGYVSDITTKQVLEQTNQRRVDEGLQPLILDPTLSDAARRKASDMFTFDYWAHTNPHTGREPWYFFDAVGYRYQFAGENLARDFSTTSPMVQAWMDSTSHRDNILSSRYVDTGIAVVNGQLNGIETTLVVQLFGVKKQLTQVPQLTSEAQATTLGSTAIPETESAPTSGPTSPPVEPTLSQPLTETTTTTQVNSTSSNMHAVLSPLDLSRSLAIGALLLVVTVTIVDGIIVWRRKTTRMVGHNWAHVLFLIGMITIITTLSQGAIR